MKEQSPPGPIDEEEKPEDDLDEDYEQDYEEEPYEENQFERLPPNADLSGSTVI
jgi:hypothetical protein